MIIIYSSNYTVNNLCVPVSKLLKCTITNFKNSTDRNKSKGRCLAAHSFLYDSMTQAAIKARLSERTRSRTFKSPNNKKGRRDLPPKKTVLIKQRKLTKKFSAARTAQTERTLATKTKLLKLLSQDHQKIKQANKQDKGQDHTT